MLRSEWFKQRVTGRRSPCRSTGMATVLMLCSISGAAAADLSITRPEYFMDIPSKYDSMPFDIGPVKTIESPDPAIFRSLVIPVYEGVPRFGTWDSYLVKDPTKNKLIWQTKQERTAVTKRLKLEVELYLSLLALQFGGEHVNAENVKYYKPEGPPTEALFSHRGYTPRLHVTAVASGLTTARAYEEFFCAEAASCRPGNNRLIYLLAQHVLSLRNAWGGSGNEFTTQAAVNKFVASHLATLIDWSKNLSPDFAMVETVALGDYDFEKGGFHLVIRMPRGSATLQNSAFQYYQIETSKVVLADKFGSNMAGTFLAMAPDAAEALLEELKSDYGQRYQPRVYFVMKARFYDFSFRRHDFNGGGGSLILYDLISDSIGIFKDESLTQRVADVILNRKSVSTPR